MLTLLNNNHWTLLVFFVITFSLLFSYLESRLYHRFVKQNIKSKSTQWKTLIIHALHRPLNTVIWLLGLLFALQIAAQHALQDPLLSRFIAPTRTLTIILSFIWFSLQMIQQIETRALQNADSDKHRLDKATVHALCQLFRVAILITTALVILQVFGVPISGLLAFGGIGGLAIGFAAKDLLANFFGGLMIFLDRPFQIGDWVRSPDKNIEGTVEHIGWRLTRIRTFDKRPLYVPNGTFSTISIENPSRMRNRRIKALIGLRYDDAERIKQVIDDVRQMLQNHPDIDTSQTLIVNLVEFGSSALNFMVYTFTKTTDWVEFQEVQENVFLKILAIIRNKGAECAYPTTTLHVPGVPNEEP